MADEGRRNVAITRAHAKQISFHMAEECLRNQDNPENMGPTSATTTEQALTTIQGREIVVFVVVIAIFGIVIVDSTLHEFVHDDAV